MIKRDYYEVLGVDRNSPKGDIKKAYRSAAIKYHPDKNPDDIESEEKFKEAAEAYEVLHDDKKREVYNRFGHEGLKGTGFTGFRGFEDIVGNFGDIFEDFFGGGMGGFGRSRQSGGQGADLRFHLTIELEEAAAGVEKVIDVEKNVPCSVCHGARVEPGHSAETCTTCGGYGQVRRTQGFFSINMTCHTCGGSGQEIKHYCKACSGAGKEKQEKQLRIKVPPGMESGSHLRLVGEGEPGLSNAPDGDLYVLVEVKDHAVYERHGNDLASRLPITFAQAALGAEIEVPTLLGKASLKIPAGTQTHKLFRLRGEGMPVLHGREKGDLLVQVIVQTPEKLNKEQEKLFREYAKLSGEKIKEPSKGFFQNLYK